MIDNFVGLLEGFVEGEIRYYYNDDIDEFIQCLFLDFNDVDIVINQFVECICILYFIFCVKLKYFFCQCYINVYVVI